ncbi:MULTISPECIES: class I SAM-dependent methyltransferase [Calothrix]|uniref:Class I SAM-dependent methyltransferase n=2 Tax=Calothrix TaxID=1186 RepID=A0ABR8AL76_9CYAN|nr:MULTISPECIES: class I SAM-dependent methyltransferase [Calothrix]MBD2200793.1 class I SAM-dependent methyltransferase [Calothrix parietina FACHB-288]MBD2229824.1 class I SAM-dependent methyltransferase [Calothrix anomala FACHB-343]
MSAIGKSISHTIRYFLGLEPAHTQTTHAERECLANFATGKQRLVEIGVYEGVTTRLLANQIDSNATLLAIDPFFPGKLGICWGRFIAKREVHLSANTSSVMFIERFSYDAVSEVEGNLDFIFIDGDHSLEGIKRDWIDWSDKVAQNGIIALHDTRVPNHNPRIAELGSFQFFESHIRHDSRFKLIGQIDSLSVLQRL